MKWLVIAALCTPLLACTDEQNVGNTYTLRSTRWAVSVPTLDDQSFAWARHVQIDPDGDVIAAGSFRGTVDFGDGPISTADPVQTDAFWVSKRSSVDGSNVWTVVLGGTPGATFELWDVRVDRDGSTILAGKTYGTQPIADQSVTTQALTAFVAKLAPDGHVAWIRTLDAVTESSANVRTLAVGPDGRIYIGGDFTGVLQFPQASLLSTPDSKYYIAAFEPDGTLRWGRQYSLVGGLEVASDGSLVMVATLQQSTTFAGTFLDLSKVPGHLLARLTTDGDVTSVGTFGTVGVQYEGTWIALDAEDRIATTTTITASDGNTASNSLLDASGEELWTAAPVSGRIASGPIATNGHAVLTAGELVDWTVDLGSGEQVGSMYIAARDLDGTLLDSTVYGDPSAGDAFWDLAMSAEGGVAFAAQIEEPIDFGSGPVPGALHDPTFGAAVIGLFAPAP